MPQRRVLMGRIVGIFGVRGQVKIESWTEPRQRIFAYQPWFVQSAQGHEQVFEKVSGREHGKGLLATLPGIDDRDAAQALMNSQISIAREHLPHLPQDTFYWADLEGLDVVTLSGTRLGRVSHLMATGANDVLVIHGDGREHLVPYVNGRYVKQVDLAGGRLVVDWDSEF